MLKTNSKAAKEKIRSFIIANTNEECSNRSIIGCSEYILDDFRRVNDRELKKMGSQEAFYQFCSGLPSCLACDEYLSWISCGNRCFG